MISLRETPITGRDERALLQKLRDLNLGACDVEVGAGERVRIEGCLSVDAPVELGVLYGLRRCDGRAEVLDLAFSGGRLLLTRSAREREHGDTGSEQLLMAVFADRFGRLSVPELRARLDPGGNAQRELERFLRRIVRGAYLRMRPQRR